MPLDDNSLETAAVSDIVHSSYHGSDSALLAPDESMVATADDAVQLNVSVQEPLTVSAWGVEAVVDFLKSKMQSPGENLAGNVAGCAQAVGEMWSKVSGTKTWQQTVGEAFQTAGACSSLWEQVSDSLHIESRTAAANEIVSVAEHLRGPAFEDALKYVGRALELVH